MWKTCGKNLLTGLWTVFHNSSAASNCAGFPMCLCCPRSTVYAAGKYLFVTFVFFCFEEGSCSLISAFFLLFLSEFFSLSFISFMPMEDLVFSEVCKSRYDVLQGWYTINYSACLVTVVVAFFWHANILGKIRSLSGLFFFSFFFSFSFLSRDHLTSTIYLF